MVESQLEDLLEGADEVFGLARREESRLGSAPDAIHGRAGAVAHDEGHPPAEEHHRPETAALEVELAPMRTAVLDHEVTEVPIVAA